jgi:hypothetical protein
VVKHQYSFAKFEGLVDGILATPSHVRFLVANSSPSNTLANSSPSNTLGNCVEPIIVETPGPVIVAVGDEVDGLINRISVTKI